MLQEDMNSFGLAEQQMIGQEAIEDSKQIIL